MNRGGVRILADVPIAMLVAGAIVLLASTVVLTRTLPVPRWPRWARRSRHRRRERLVITGRVPELPPGPLPMPSSPLAITPPRQAVTDRDVHDERLANAEATIDELLDTDPDHLARMISLWIRNGEARR